MEGKVLSLQEIENIARKNLSNYEGEENYGGEENYEGEDSYEGMDPFGGDDFVEYDGINLNKDGGNMYTLTLTNANAAPRVALLSAGIVSTSIGLIKTGAFNDANNAAGLSGAGSPKAIELFTEFCRRNPTKISMMQILSTDPAQIYSTMIIRNESPFRDLDSRLINFGSHVSPADNKDKLVIVPTHLYKLQFDDQNRVEFTVPGLATTTITFFIGPLLNTAGALNKKYNKAIRKTRKRG